MYVLTNLEMLYSPLNPTLPFLRANTLFSVEKLEVETSTFALELLLPDEFISQYKNINITIYDITEIHSVPKKTCSPKKFLR
ncbi:Zn-dependent peptidase ImmA (M78 family) [Anoxybacillus caldiproteolyticus]|uniref:Zn-dependent peptidase ImmA (M78 family) n=1 Tax=Thermaerobacillus caldiproteolyticus TaxID=247480 RepID=A0A7W0BZC6_9BACL|nr:Zn-dependent peptidase ImmA (M78 family) [Anoxybacillus caldiproteolyticus]